MTQYTTPNKGQTTVPTFLTNAAGLGAGFFHSLATGNNQRPNATPQTIYGYPNSDLVVQFAGTDTNNDLLRFSLAALPATGTLYQYVEGVRGAAITVGSKMVTDPQGRVIFVAAADAAGRPYTTFSFVANDGEADSTSATVTVNIIPAPVMVVSNLSMDTNGAFSLGFAGLTNASYRVWASTNLSAWRVLGFASQSPPGIFQFTDTAASNWPQQFYRVTCP
jgi:hypothetical protein